MNGAQSVMMIGTYLMQVWCVNSWATARVLQWHTNQHTLGRGLASYGLMMSNALVLRKICMIAPMLVLGFTTAGTQRMLGLLVSATMNAHQCNDSNVAQCNQLKFNFFHRPYLNRMQYIVHLSQVISYLVTALFDILVNYV